MKSLKKDFTELKRASKESQHSPLVYIGMAADIIHHGHINIIKTGALYGTVVIGLLTDKAIKSYKRTPIVPWGKKKNGCRTLEICIFGYTAGHFGLQAKPQCPKATVCCSWERLEERPQAETRQQVIDTLALGGDFD